MMNSRSSSSSPSYNNVQNPYNSYSSSIIPPSFTSIEEEQHHQPWNSTTATTQNHHIITDTGFGVANADHPVPLAIPMNSVGGGGSSSSFPTNYFSPNLQANQYPSFIKREEGAGGSRIGLNLGHRTYFSSGDALTIDRLLTARAHQSQLQVPRCQAEGCKADLSGAKHYHKRHKVCEFHSKATAVITSGLQQRFCQQCSRFHVLSEFDESKRSCRKRLADHNRRRRKPQNLSDKTKHYSSSSSKSGTTTSATNSNGYEGNQGNKNKSTSSLGVLGEASQQQHIQYNYAQQHNYNLSSPNPANINSNGDNYYSQNFFASSSNNGVYHSTGDGNSTHLGQPIYEVDFM